MSAVDTSALLAILLREDEEETCSAVLEQSTCSLISAGTLQEALIVAEMRGIGSAMAALIERYKLQVIPVTGTSARRAAAAYRRWGKGRHPARLNFGDCFSYKLAMEYACPLLFVGADFQQTDVCAAATSPG